MSRKKKKNRGFLFSTNAEKRAITNWLRHRFHWLTRFKEIDAKNLCKSVKSVSRNYSLFDILLLFASWFPAVPSPAGKCHASRSSYGTPRDRAYAWGYCDLLTEHYVFALPQSCRGQGKEMFWTKPPFTTPQTLLQHVSSPATNRKAAQEKCGSPNIHKEKNPQKANVVFWGFKCQR